ncbi:MAG: hypothetical protein OXE59_08350 [Bacteroidetes bacterium]|nr:hypothetical protein [Bacteroidota bacterium]MCY4233730.1 hypothetical protein [Bacteroidota bacterium]
MTEEHFDLLVSRDKHSRTVILDLPPKPKPLPGLIPSENYPGIYYPTSPYKFPTTFVPERTSRNRIKQKGVWPKEMLDDLFKDVKKSLSEKKVLD